MSPSELLDKRSARQAVAIDALRRKSTVEEAATLAGVTRRTLYDWREGNPAFAAAWDSAVEERDELVTETQVEDWRSELAAIESETAGIDEQLAEIAASAMAGDSEAQQRQAEHKTERSALEEREAALRLAIDSGVKHLERRTQERERVERETARKEAESHRQAQEAAAKRIDEALALLEQQLQVFNAAALERARATRRSGAQSAPHAYPRLLAAAVFAQAPEVATALGLDRRLRARATCLQETVRA